MREGVRVTTLEDEVAATSSLEVDLEPGSGSTREIFDLILSRKVGLVSCHVDAFVKTCSCHLVDNFLQCG